MTDTGVVDPIRVPDWLRAGARNAWDRTPLVARLFIGFAILDAVMRWFGILQPGQGGFADLRGLYGFFIPRALWILLPAILLFRRPDAAEATPLVYLGAMVVAVVTLVLPPVEDLLGGGGEFTTFEVVSAIGSIAFIAGFGLLARGVRRLNPPEPAPAVAGLSNLVLAFSLVGTGTAVVSSLLHWPTEALGGGVSGPELLSMAAFATYQVVWAYFLWILIRGLGDSRRPRTAMIAAAVGAALSGILTGLTTLIGQVLFATQPSTDFSTLLSYQDVYVALGFIAIGVGEALVVVAFGLGLAEPPIPYAAPTAASPEPAPEPATEPTALPTQGAT